MTPLKPPLRRSAELCLSALFAASVVLSTPVPGHAQQSTLQIVSASGLSIPATALLSRSDGATATVSIREVPFCPSGTEQPRFVSVTDDTGASRSAIVCRPLSWRLADEDDRRVAALLLNQGNSSGAAVNALSTTGLTQEAQIGLLGGAALIGIVALIIGANDDDNGSVVSTTSTSP